MNHETGFSDVDGSARPGELVDYLGLLARALAETRRLGYERLRVATGAAVLDVGCGAGEVCVELAALVGPTGRVVGIDSSETMIAAARGTVAGVEPAIEVHVASAYSLPFADATFDAVRAERVFQHLAEPEIALAEMRRVTKPGGRVMVIDPDHGQHGLALDDREHQRVYEAMQRALLRMIENPHSGSRLFGMFAQAGFREIERYSRIYDWDYVPWKRALFLHERLAAARDAGDITEDEAKRFVEAIEARARAGTFMANVVAYCAVGVR